MAKFSLVIRYVESVEASAAFYAALLGTPPTEASPTFAMFALGEGAGLGLWARRGVQPAAQAAGGDGELAFVAPDVDAVHADWAARGLPIAQAPTDMDFGRTFVALDPDGHRLRVFAPMAS
ncbi:MAG: VOC family protein [Alphaproteobacteria bacterium]|nr:VOC family protein [Alphaproteobacteria bacterium]